MLLFSIDYDADLPSQKLRKQRFDFSLQGIKALNSLIKECNVNATIFIQANAPKLKLNKNLELCLHGLKHEDLTKLSPKKIKQNFGNAIEIFSKKFSKKPKGFRAPYLKTNDKILKLEKEFFRYDSSCYAETIKPLKKEILEVPITSYKGFKGYLIGFFRGKRKLNFLKRLKKRLGVLHLAMHSWDLFWDNKPLSEKETNKRMKFLQKLFMEFEVYSIKEFLKFCNIKI